MKINSIQNFDYKFLNQRKNKKISENIAFCSKINCAKTSEVVGIFKEMVQIPSPSLKEMKLANWILDFCKKNKINAKFDKYKNVKINIPATDNSKKPILFSAHMDVVGDDSPVNIIFDDDFIKTDGKRTLGADDKAGVAAALLLAKEINNSDIRQGGLEMLFTRDEETGMSGIENAEFHRIKSKYVSVLDRENFNIGTTVLKIENK